MEENELELRISLVSEYMYCQRNAFYEFFGFEKNYNSSPDLEKGKVVHESVDKTATRNRIKYKQQTNFNVYNKKLKLVGKLDMIEWIANLPIPVEYKKGIVTDYPNHKIQLCLQALCLEEMYSVQINKGYLFFYDANQRKEILLTPDLREKTVKLLSEIRGKIEKSNPKLFNKESNHKCPKCSFYELCLPNINKS